MIQANKQVLISAEQALPGRSDPMPVPAAHYVNGQPLQGPFSPPLQVGYFALGCFWGAERLFWQQPGVYVTAVGYAGGFTPNPTYDEVCSGLSGHAETVKVVFDPAQVSYQQLLKLFWEHHDPAQGMRQGNDVGTQYRSAVYTVDATQQQQAEASCSAYQQALRASGETRAITTEITPAGPFYYAEAYHQQYLAKHPQGYCGLAGLGVCLPPA